MNAANLRRIDLSLVCECVGLERDIKDLKQFKAVGYRVSIQGEKWYDHEARQGGGGAVDLVMHVLGLSF